MVIMQRLYLCELFIYIYVYIMFFLHIDFKGVNRVAIIGIK